jgi:hypothetical protein
MTTCSRLVAPKARESCVDAFTAALRIRSITGGSSPMTAQRAVRFHRNSFGGPMSSLISRTQAAKPMHRIGARVGAGVVAIALSAAGLAVTAGSAQARPRSCWNIGQSMEFFWLAMTNDTGASAQYFAQDNRMYNYEVRLYNAAGC